MKEKLENYIFYTKLGRFLVLIIISLLFELPFLYFSKDSFVSMFTGSFIVALILPILDNDITKWY